MSPAVERNAADLAERVNKLLVLFAAANKNRAGTKRKLTSGFRSLDANKAAGGAAYSQHMYGRAVDIEDNDRRLCNFATRAVLEECGLWREDSSATVSWAHFQSVPPPSGRRIFSP